MLGKTAPPPPPHLPLRVLSQPWHAARQQDLGILRWRTGAAAPLQEGNRVRRNKQLEKEVVVVTLEGV